MQTVGVAVSDEEAALHCAECVQGAIGFDDSLVFDRLKSFISETWQFSESSLLLFQKIRSRKIRIAHILSSDEKCNIELKVCYSR